MFMFLIITLTSGILSKSLLNSRKIEIFIQMLILDTPMKMEIALKLNWTMKEKWSGLDILARILLEKE